MINKRVLWIISELFPPDETSTSYILGEIANICTKEYDVHVISGPEKYDVRKAFDINHPFCLNPVINVIRTQTVGGDKNTTLGKVRSLFVTSYRLYKIAKHQVHSGDKVLLVTNPAPLVLLLSKLKKKRLFELSLLVHDVFPENTVPAGLHIPSKMFRFMKHLFDKAYSCADRIIALGRDMAEVLRNKVGEGAKIIIVENWAEVDEITPIPFPDSTIRLEYAGNLGRVQGLNKLVSGLPEGVEMHFYGTGAMENSLKEMKHPHVFFHGPYLRSQQKNVLGACHAAIVTLSDGMYGLGVPSKAYNIMAAGRPIIYFGPEDGEIGLMVKENGIGYLGWPQKWDLDELKQMGERARALAESKYSKKVILNKFIDAIR